MTTTTVDAERAWLTWAGRHGVPAVPLSDLPSTLLPSYEVMDREPVATPGLTVALGQLQGWLHGLPVDDAPGPVVRWASAVEELGVRWNTAVPDAPRLAPCHGDFTPVTVLVRADDLHELSVTGWGSAVVSDREYDVAYTELGLWAAPYLAADLARRPMLKMARGFLLNGYRAGYAAAAGAPDPHRLRLWGAYHACRALGAPLEDLEPFRSWDAGLAATTLATFRADLRARVDDLLPDADLPV